MVKKNQRVIPVSGRYFGPTNSEAMMKNITVVPGPKNPSRNLVKVNTQKTGENELRNATRNADTVQGTTSLFRPYLE